MLCLIALWVVPAPPILTLDEWRYHTECLHAICFYAESNPALKKLLEVSESDVEMKFAELLSHACEKLEGQKVSPDEFRTFAVAAFHLSALQN